MMQTLQLQVSLMRRFGRIKAAFADAFSVYHKLHAPFILMRRHTQQANFVGFSSAAHVLQIFRSRHFSKIGKTIVLLVAVFMVNMAKRKCASHVQPRQTMRKSFLIVDCDSPIAHICWTARAFADKIRPRFMRNPNKLARIGVVTKDRSDMVNGNHDIQFTMKVA